VELMWLAFCYSFLTRAATTEETPQLHNSEMLRRRRSSL